MVRRSIYPPAEAWTIFATGSSIFLCFLGFSLTKAKVYQLELAEYKLEVGSVISDVRKVSDTLERSAKTSPIAPDQKRKIEELTAEVSEALEQAESDIELETEKLIHNEE